MRNNNKIGHLAPKGYRVNLFNSIEIEGDYHYCQSHNFIFNSVVEYQKLHLGLPCYYTDKRFRSSRYNFYKNCKIYWTRFKDISLKSSIRRTLNCYNIPVGTIVHFDKSWSFSGKKFSTSFNFKIRKENKIDIQYEVSKDGYFNNFSNCDFSKQLTEELRKNGFLVYVEKNESFLGNMINSAISLSGGDLMDTEIEGDVAIAYGHNKIIGFSSFKNDLYGYSNGCDNILWDVYGEFDKWSRCNEISKNTSIEEIVEILIS